jgi:hypothetical protein
MLTIVRLKIRHQTQRSSQQQNLTPSLSSYFRGAQSCASAAQWTCDPASRYTVALFKAMWMAKKANEALAFDVDARFEALF